MNNRSSFSDVSSNNLGYNAAQYASAGYGAIAIKATEGTGYVNPDYERWVEESHAHGLPVFHYMFARPEQGDPHGQVEHFWDTIRRHFHRPGDFVVLDVETGDPSAASEWLRIADRRLHDHSNTHPVCYCPLSYYQEGELSVESGDFWIAAWGDVRPGRRWKLNGKDRLWGWQHTNGMPFAGITANADGSYLNPTLAAYLWKVRTDRKRKAQHRR